MNRSGSLGATIPSSFVRNLAAAVAEQGGEPETAFLASVGLDHSQLAALEFVPADAFARLYQRAMWRLQNEALGLVSHGKVATGSFRMLCLASVHQPDLESVIRRAGEFLDVCRGVAVKPRVRLDGESASIEMVGVDAPEVPALAEVLEAAGPMGVRTTLYMWMNLFSWFIGRQLELERVSFDFPSPPRGAEWHRLFGAEVVFDARICALVLPAETLELPNLQTEAAAEVFVKSVPLRLLIPAFRDQPVSDRVLGVFGEDLSRGLPASEQIAACLGMSISTLRRRLLEEGTSLQQLKDDARQAAAIRYLSVPELSAREVAELVGFDDPSAFQRAFRRWTGVTPGVFRRSLGQSGE
ncbi:MAG: AraC family transcriptional regulator [Gammaproteobacteria bacterium]|nr:MAG: AraC family transcriptional regulator [Gammaproteobacteria bacterium]